MNILAINGSPRGAAGNTEALIHAFLEGAARGGDSVETIYLKEKRIQHCTGCFTCWFKTPGICMHDDDMSQILEKGRHADILVFGSPLYIYNFSGLMKDFMDMTHSHGSAVHGDGKRNLLPSQPISGFPSESNGAYLHQRLSGAEPLRRDETGLPSELW